MLITVHSLLIGSLAGVWTVLTFGADFSSRTQYCSLTKLTTLWLRASPSTLQSYLLLLNPASFCLFVMLTGL